jgi:hypothetical protein
MKILLSLLLAIGTLLGQTRDPAYWPFSVHSPWNTPLAATAKYSGANDAATLDLIDPKVTADINCMQWSIPVYVAKPGDPWVDLALDPSLGEKSGLDPSIHPNHPVSRIRASSGATPALPAWEEVNYTDAHLALIDEDHHYVVEMWRAKRTAPGRIAAFTMVRNDLTGTGVGYGGARAFGGSAIGGLIRHGELASGIHHTLGFAIPRSKQKCCEAAWPATSVDGGARGSYRGHLPMGQLVAIPPDVDLRSLGLSPQGLAIAKALQDYGAYDVDSSQDFSIYAEPAAASELGKAKEDLKRIRPLLRCVTNNGPDTPGGGGPNAKRRAPWAPELGRR